jgi:hypothetical protein
VFALGEQKPLDGLAAVEGTQLRDEVRGEVFDDHAVARVEADLDLPGTAFEHGEAREQGRVGRQEDRWHVRGVEDHVRRIAPGGDREASEGAGTAELSTSGTPCGQLGSVTSRRSELSVPGLTVVGWSKHECPH